MLVLQLLGILMIWILDFNDLDLSQILLLDGYVQVVDKPTRDQNILDKVITNFSYAYEPVTILSPLGMSDHNCILLRPSADFLRPSRLSNKKRKKLVRPLTDSGIREFGSWITQHTWEELYKITNPSDMCNMFLQILQQRIDKLLPLKEIVFHDNDKPWINSEVKTLINKRQHAFKDNKELWKHYRLKVKKAIVLAKDSFL